MVQSADLMQSAPLERLRWRTVSRGVQLVQTSQPQPGSDLATTCVRCVAAHSFASGGITAAGDSESALLLFRICLTHALRKLTIVRQGWSRPISRAPQLVQRGKASGEQPQLDRRLE